MENIRFAINLLMNLRLLCLVFIVFSLASTQRSTAQGWQWAKSAGGAANESATAVATDTSGYVYAVGSFSSGTVSFGSFILNNITTAFTDIFVVKYDSLGNVIWARSAGGSDNDYATSISIDPWGNIYVAGFFYSPTIAFGATTLTNDSANTSDMYVVKYDQAGTVLWAKKAGGTMDDRINAIKADGAGNVIVTGSFQSKYLIFGTDTVKNPLETTDEVFVIKYDSTGSFTWATGTGPYGDDYGYAVTTDATNNIYVAGKFISPTINFGNGVVVSNTTGGGSNDDLFLVKYNAAGLAQWADHATGASDDAATALGIDAHSNIYVAGKFASPTLIFNATSLTNAGGYDIFVAKYSSSGHLVWAKSNGGTSNDYVNSISIDDSSNVVIAGNYASSIINFGPSTLINDSVGTSDIFIARYDSLGNAQWAKTTGGPKANANGVATDGSGNIYLAGDFSDSSFYFGTNLLLNAINSNTTDMFLAKYSLTTTIAVNINLPENKIALYPNPASGVINVVLNGGGYNSISVYDCFGRMVYKNQLTGNEKTTKINTYGLNDGVYFLHAMHNDGMDSATFVI